MDTVYFDSSIFIAIFAGLGKKSDLCALLRELKRDKVKIYTSIITVQEVSVVIFRKGTMVADNYSKVDKLARIAGINKEIALTAAKYEALIIEQTDRGDQEDNKRRKWDCFHIATAMDLRCKTLYTLDEKMLKRKRQFDIPGMDFALPVPSKRELFEEPDLPDTPEVKDAEPGKTAEERPEQPKAIASPPEIQGSSSGHSENKTAKQEAFHKEVGEEKMNDVIDLFGPCEADRCKRDERAIVSEADRVIIREKLYHRGCEPTEEELKARDRSPA